jgi:hypothetical protein
MQQQSLIIDLEGFVNPLDYEGSSIEPEYLSDTSGAKLFAPGLVHWIYGPSETGKSFIGLTACLEAGGVYFSLEMGLRAMSHRIQKMGYDKKQSKYFLFNLDKSDLLAKVREVSKFNPTVVVFDAFGELSSIFGKDTNSDQDVADIFHKVFTPLIEAGHALIVIDHIAKNPGNIDYPLGTQNKKSQSDICIHINYDHSSHLLKLTVTKDRHDVYFGRYLGGDREYGHLEITTEPSRAVIHRMGFEDFGQTAGASIQEKEVQDRIMIALEGNSGMAKTLLEASVRGKEKVITKAIVDLEKGGYLTITPGKTDDGYRCKVVARTDKTWSYTPTISR